MFFSVRVGALMATSNLYYKSITYSPVYKAKAKRV